MCIVLKNEKGGKEKKEKEKEKENVSKRNHRNED